MPSLYPSRRGTRGSTQTEDGCPYLPSGEKEMLCTEPLKWKWWSTDLHTRLTSKAAPPATEQSDTVATPACPPWGMDCLDPGYDAELDPRRCPCYTAQRAQGHPSACPCQHRLPSSTMIARRPSGDSPTHLMLYLVARGNVSDLLLRNTKTPGHSWSRVLSQGGQGQRWTSSWSC